MIPGDRRHRHMRNGIERRRHIRAPLAIDVVLKTSEGTIKGKTADISVSGLAVILFIDQAEISDEFEITLRLSQSHEISINCAKIWAGKMISAKTLYNAIGVEFIKIAPTDRKTLVTMIFDYYRDSP